MKLGIISDTHIIKHISVMQKFLDSHLKDVDIIIHAGDYGIFQVLETLKSYGQFVGVWGNTDCERIRSLLQEQVIIELCGCRIGIFHGHGRGKTTPERAYDRFKDEKVDIIVFGHSHQPLVKSSKGVLMLNPGSPTVKRRERWYSYIILELDKDTIKPELVLFTPIK